MTFGKICIYWKNKMLLLSLIFYSYNRPSTLVLLNMWFIVSKDGPRNTSCFRICWWIWLIACRERDALELPSPAFTSCLLKSSLCALRNPSQWRGHMEHHQSTVFPSSRELPDTRPMNPMSEPHWTASSIWMPRWGQLSRHHLQHMDHWAKSIHPRK